MADFEFRGLELHTTRLYQMSHIERAIEFCLKFGLNSLILHQNDIADKFVMPAKYIDYDQQLKYIPIRQSLGRNYRVYFKNVGRKVYAAGLKLYFELKEIYYGEGILSLYPEVVGPNGFPCPAHPFWFEFVEEKMRELCETMPHLNGVIVSAGTKESMLSIVKAGCECEKCKATNPYDWYKNLLAAMFRPLNEAGRELIVRDFSFSRDNQNIMMDAAGSVSSDIILALKNTPQDYFPCFPNNPRIGMNPKVTNYVEFDTWGQFYGLGFFPCSVLEDMQNRMRWIKERGAKGIWLRTDWENCTEGSSFGSMNQLNVIAGAMLSNNIDTDLDDIYKAWCEHGLMDEFLSGSYDQPMYKPTDPGAWIKLRDYMRASWKVMEKAIYVRGNLYHYSSMFPVDLQDCYYRMIEHSVLNEYSPGAFDRVEPTAENIAAIIAEKAAAYAEVKQLPSILKPDTLGLPDVFVANLKAMLELYELYVEGWTFHTPVYFYVRKAENEKTPEAIADARQAISNLEAYNKKLYSQTYDLRLKMPHYFDRLMAVESIESFLASAHAAVDALG